MKKININFELKPETTVQDFWKCIYQCLCAPNPLYADARKIMKREHKDLTSFSENFFKYENKKIQLDVEYDNSYKSLTIKFYEESEARTRNIEVFLDYYDEPIFYYEESVINNNELAEDEIIRYPKLLSFLSDYISFSNEMMTVSPIVDSNGGYEKKLELIKKRYKGIAEVQPLSEEEIRKLNPKIESIKPGYSLVLINNHYFTVFKLERIDQLDWYLFSRSNSKWRYLEQKRRDSEKKS